MYEINRYLFFISIIQILKGLTKKELKPNFKSMLINYEYNHKLT